MENDNKYVAEYAYLSQKQCTHTPKKKCIAII